MRLFLQVGTFCEAKIEVTSLEIKLGIILPPPALSYFFRLFFALGPRWSVLGLRPGSNAFSALQVIKYEERIMIFLFKYFRA